MTLLRPLPLVSFAPSSEADRLMLTLEWRTNRQASIQACPVFGAHFTPTLGSELFLVRPDGRLHPWCVDLDSLTHYYLDGDEANRPAGPYPYSDDGEASGPRTCVAVALDRPSVHLGLLNLFLVAQAARDDWDEGTREALARLMVRHADALFENHGHQWDLVNVRVEEWYAEADRTEDPFWSHPSVLRPHFPALAAEVEHAWLSRNTPDPQPKGRSAPRL